MSEQTHAPAVRLQRIVDEAVRDRGIPCSLAHDAARITAHVLLNDGSDASDRRIRAYFWGVVRRRCLRSTRTEHAQTKARFILESVRRDLVAAGLSAREVETELRRHHADLIRESALGEQLAIPA